jgi:uracil-DNA glycosylase family 4
MQNSLSALTWLVEAGADEAIGEEAVDRFAAKKPQPNPSLMSNPPLEGGSKNAEHFSGRRQAPVTEFRPSPKAAARVSTLPQGEGGDSIGDAIALARAANSLPELKAALESFDGCALKRSATNTVFADGNPASRILLIGEAPGRDEDRQGLPFVGRAGKLLDKMLAAIDLDRTSAYITNVLNWRPPDNREPSPEEAALCLPFLRRHIELVDPLVMILLGGTSVRHVMGRSDGIMKTHGRWLEYNVSGRMVPVMPTLHPAYLLRQPAHKKLAWRDLLAVEQKIIALRALEQSAGGG